MFAATSFACGDDESGAGAGTDGGPDVSLGTGTDSGGDPTGDAGSDGPGNSGFTPKDDCEAPQIAFSAPHSISKFSLAAAPGSPIIAGYGSLAEQGGSTFRCEARTYAGGTWSAPDTTFDPDCDEVLLRVASGGGHAVAFSRERLSTTSKRRRTTGGAFADFGSAAGGDQKREVAIGSAGHVVDTGMTGAGLTTVLYGPTGDDEVILPINSAPSNGVQAIANLVDASGDGFVVWLSASPPTLHARAFRSGAWAGDEASMSTGVPNTGETLSMSATLLPNGDASVVWSNVVSGDNPPGVRGATVHHDAGAGSSAWSATVEEIDPDAVNPTSTKVLADGDGNLTALWLSGSELHARRHVGGAWGEVASLGSATYLSAIIDPEGHVTAITFDGAQELFHYRAEKGAAAWLPRVKVSAANGASDSAGVAIDPSTGDLLIAWRDPSKTIYSAICR